MLLHFVDFEGLAIQLVKVNRETAINVIIANDVYVWERAQVIPTDQWFDFVLGWSPRDGIQFKIDNKKVSGTVSQ